VSYAGHSNFYPLWDTGFDYLGDKIPHVPVFVAYNLQDKNRKSYSTALSGGERVSGNENRFDLIVVVRDPQWPDRARYNLCGTQLI
jgi:hypothetical protein